jgi:hypothetical protein
MRLSTEQIQRLVGMNARLWDFMPSHDHLVIKCTKNAEELFLVLSGCNEIDTPVFWNVEAPRVSPIDGGFFEFVDSNVRITFQDAAIQDAYSRAQ